MQIQVNNVKFSGFPKVCKVQSSLNTTKPLRQADTFIRTTTKDLPNFKNIKIGPFLNAGREAEVYTTNNKDYVIRIVNQSRYIPEAMIPIEDGNGLIVATNKDDTVQLLKYIKGKPLYGKNWEILSKITKDEYLETFHKVMKLPDKAFSDYIKRIVDIRAHGYDIDTINPNNILLDGNKLNIVDIEKRSMSPKIWMDDFDALIDSRHLQYIIKEMSESDIKEFSQEVKNFYDRMIRIAKNEGYQVYMPALDKRNPQDLKVYVYHKDMNMIKALTS